MAIESEVNYLRRELNDARERYCRALTAIGCLEGKFGYEIGDLDEWYAAHIERPRLKVIQPHSFDRGRSPEEKPNKSVLRIAN